MRKSWIRQGGLLIGLSAILTACSTPAPSPIPISPTPKPTLPVAAAPTLYVCPGMTVSNAPEADDKRKIVGYLPWVRVDGVALMLNPAPGACLSSGFGPRNGRPHKGLDFHATMGAPIVAGGDGVVLEAVFRNDFGNMLVVDHGHGVYTRYCHLQAFADNLVAGTRVKAGEVIGYMGNTANPPVAVHLHYEMLTGTYDTPKKSFGLTALDPLAQPPA